MFHKKRLPNNMAVTPDNGHLVIRTKVSPDNRGVDYLMVDTNKLLLLTLWVTAVGSFSVYLALNFFAPHGQWLQIIFSILCTITPVAVAYSGYKTQWGNKGARE